MNKEYTLPEELPRGLSAIHAKLDLLWLLLGDVAKAQGFPQSYIDTLHKEWGKVTQ